MIRRLFSVLVTVVAVLAGLAVLLLLTSHLYRIPASSMEPTLHCAKPALGCRGRWDDRIVVPRFGFKKLHRGDLAAFKTPPLARSRCGSGGIFVKRVVALGGERFEEREGRILVNGRRLKEPYVKYPDRQTFPPRRIPRGTYFMLGDNRAQSCDSRIFGGVPKKLVIGKVVATYWPPTRMTIR